MVCDSPGARVYRRIMTNPSTDEAIARILAENEIRNLIGRIAHLADDGELDPDYISLFTEDASWGAVDTEIRHNGREEILAAARERRAAGRQGQGTGLLHMNTSLTVRVDGPDEAHAESYFIVTKRDADGQGAVIAGSGRYLDTLRRTGEGWKFADRTVVLKVT